MSRAPARRSTLSAELVALAEREGHRWAAAVLAARGAEGRALGGWPHTVPEARARVGSLLDRQIDRQTSEEVALATYRFAREHWGSRAGREPEAP